MNDIDLIDTNLSAKNETDEKDEDFGVRLTSMMPIFGGGGCTHYLSKAVRPEARYDFDENCEQL